MLIEKLHADEVDIDTDQVAQMIADQFPRWSGLPLAPVDPAGTDNVMLKLGGSLVIRLPRTPSATKSLEKELIHPPTLRAFLPTAIPCVIETGAPTAGYPFKWSVSRWLKGRNPRPGRASNDLAVDLARFVTALHGIVAPVASRDLLSYRGGPLAARDPETRAAIARCEGHFDTNALSRAWDIALGAPVGNDPHTWIHTDLQPGNLLIEREALSGVLDWGGLAIGDPAVDLIVAWNLLDPDSRQQFRQSLTVSDAMWQRGRAWALTIGLVAYPYYIDSNPALAAVSKYQIQQVLQELTSGAW
ncbi:aminoglycoside phosphotransferase family protein [Specibacter sp. RAF43]|uniref:aminoglycoside phosphotransferase family protein n=1 Tax=Specibacter sp. RAF43 TaxID=3233057 RepID=UPI003F9737B3